MAMLFTVERHLRLTENAAQFLPFSNKIFTLDNEVYL